MYYKNLTTSSLEIERMNFRLPDHTKVMYASGKVRQKWQLLVNEASNAWQEVEKLSLVEGVRDSILIFAFNWKQWKDWADQYGFIIVPLRATGVEGYNSYGDQPGDTWRCAVVRNKEIAAEWMDIWHDGNDMEIGRLLGYPNCCQNFFNHFWGQEDWRDLTVPAILNDGIDGPPEANILGRWTGIRLVSHMPCSFSCESSVAIGRKMAEIGRKNGLEKQVETIYKLLNMPYKYSSLHGIAEITTPIWKVSAASEPFAEEVVFEREGEIPELSASGKAFPFTNQAKSEITESNAFKRAIEHYKNGSDSDIDFDVRHDLNGFTTKEGQIHSHQPILDLIEQDCGQVVDFGCGNGALLAKIQHRFRTSVIGVEKKEEAVLFGKLEWGLDIDQGDMFEVSIPGDTAIIMPGRFEEAGEEKTEEFLSWLHPYRFIIAYAYSDWIEKIDFETVFGDEWIIISEEQNEHCKAVKFQNIDRL